MSSFALLFISLLTCRWTQSFSFSYPSYRAVLGNSIARLIVASPHGCTEKSRCGSHALYCVDEAGTGSGTDNKMSTSTADSDAALMAKITANAEDNVFMRWIKWSLYASLGYVTIHDRMFKDVRYAFILLPSELSECCKLFGYLHFVFNSISSSRYERK